MIIVADPRSQLERLWTSAFGEPPAIRAEAAELAFALVGGLPKAPPYGLSGPPDVVPVAPACEGPRSSDFRGRQ